VRKNQESNTAAGEKAEDSRIHIMENLGGKQAKLLTTERQAPPNQEVSWDIGGNKLTREYQRQMKKVTSNGSF